MEIKIGVQNVSREITIDSDESSESIEKAVAQALASDDGLLRLVDTKGRRVIVPADKLGFVELGSPASSQVGFRS